MEDVLSDVSAYFELFSLAMPSKYFGIGKYGHGRYINASI